MANRSGARFRLARIMESTEQQPKTLTDMVGQIEQWLAAQDRSGNADQLAGILKTVVKLSNDGVL